MAPRRDVRHAAWRTAPAVACGRRAWRRTRHLATKAARQSRGQTFLQACAALEPRAAQDRHRSTAQLSGRKGRNSGVDEREARVRLNNRAENSHQPTRERERRMRGFRDPKRTQEFLSYFGPIRQHFALKRHLLRASLYRKQLAARFVAWREFTEQAQNPSTGF